MDLKINVSAMDTRPLRVSFARAHWAFGPLKRTTWIGRILFLGTASCSVNSVPLQRLNTLFERQHKHGLMLRKHKISMYAYA